MDNKKALVWIRDDFRINRNRALVFASENHDQVSCVYIFNPEEYENKREAQRWWIYHSLINFKHELSKYNITNLKIHQFILKVPFNSFIFT